LWAGAALIAIGKIEHSLLVWTLARQMWRDGFGRRIRRFELRVLFPRAKESDTVVPDLHFLIPLILVGYQGQERDLLGHSGCRGVREPLLGMSIVREGV
jgi:hypothetical protein